MKTQYNHPVTLRITDYDVFGHVNNAAFLTIIEEARKDIFINQMGIDLTKVTGVVANINITYLRPINFQPNQTIDVQMKIIGVNGSKIMVSFELVDDKTGVVYAKASMMQMTIDMKSMKPTTLPVHIQEPLERAVAA